MSTIETSPGHELDPVVAAATAGDESAFSELVHRYEAELHAHCYRMLRSHADSEDVTQETFLRAWRSRASFQGRSSFRVWLHRIATNSCLTALERRTRRREADRATDLTPSPTRLLEGIPATEAGPDDDIVSKESVELVLRALRHLPPAQRAVVFLRDVLGWSARDTAELLDTSLASVTSAHQRARAKLRKLLPERRLEWCDLAGCDHGPARAARPLSRHGRAKGRVRNGAARRLAVDAAAGTSMAGSTV